MKREAEIKELLINNAVHLIAVGGFERVTTKVPTHYGGTIQGFKMNEVYIYRIFGSMVATYLKQPATSSRGIANDKK